MMTSTQRMTFNGFEDRTTLTVGMIVELDDGDVGTIAAIEGNDVHVRHDDRDLGCGPFVWSRSQVLEADDFAADSYTKDCDRNHYR